jgi:UrcA family protein
MKFGPTNTWKLAAPALVLVALTFPLALPAFAQEPSENVTVFAPYVVKKTSTGMTRNRVTTVSMSRKVSFSDLDLSTAEGKAALESRVKETAANVCKELDRRYPSQSVDEDKNCVQEAIDEAMISVRGVEKAASVG